MSISLFGINNKTITETYNSKVSEFKAMQKGISNKPDSNMMKHYVQLLPLIQNDLNCIKLQADEIGAVLPWFEKDMKDITTLKSRLTEMGKSETSDKIEALQQQLHDVQKQLADLQKQKKQPPVARKDSLIGARQANPWESVTTFANNSQFDLKLEGGERVPYGGIACSAISVKFIEAVLTNGAGHTKLTTNDLDQILLNGQLAMNQFKIAQGSRGLLFDKPADFSGKTEDEILLELQTRVEKEFLTPEEFIGKGEFANLQVVTIPPQILTKNPFFKSINLQQNGAFATKLREIQTCCQQLRINSIGITLTGGGETYGLVFSINQEGKIRILFKDSHGCHFIFGKSPAYMVEFDSIAKAAAFLDMRCPYSSRSKAKDHNINIMDINLISLKRN